MASTVTGPKSFVITKSDTVNEQAQFTRLYVGGAGTVTVVNQDDTVALYSAVPVGTWLYAPGKRVNATGSTATLIVAVTG